MSKEFQGKVVRKPWGYEYPIYENDRVGIWHLHIEHGQRTSLHCHPNKRTILLSMHGLAIVSTMSSVFSLNPINHTTFKPEEYHSTSARYSSIDILEIEIPNDKKDLRRLYDAYGREGMPYEGDDQCDHKFGELCMCDVSSRISKKFHDIEVGLSNMITINPFIKSSDDFLFCLSLCTGEQMNVTDGIIRGPLFYIKKD